MKKNTIYKTLLTSVFFATVFVTLSCEKKSTGIKSEEHTTDFSPEETLNIDDKLAEKWWARGGEILNQSLQTSRELQHHISEFIDNPNEEGLKRCQLSWSNTAKTYRAFYAWHLLARNEPKLFYLLSELDYRIAAYPIQPGALDSFGSYLYSGLVHELGNPLNMENLLALHGQIDSENATLGMYAIEFMLFGEDGNRHFEDYLSQDKVTKDYHDRGFSKTSELPNNRRRLLLTLQSGKLVEDLSVLASSWAAPNTSSQITLWESLSSSQKYRALKGALEQGLAELLIEDKERLQPEMLLAQLQALKVLPEILQMEHKKEIEKEFSVLEQLLSTTDTATGTATDTESSRNAPQAIEIDISVLQTHLGNINKLVSPPAITEQVENTEELSEASEN